MTPEEAFALLRLAPGASPDEIGKAFRETVRSVHPDTGTARDRVPIDEVIKAREIACRYAQTEPCPQCQGQGKHKFPNRIPGVSPFFALCPACGATGLRHHRWT